VIDGENAKEHPALDYWNMERGIIKLSGSSIPGNKMVKYIVIENLEIRNARLGKSFIGKTGGSGLYESNAAAIYVEQAENLVIRNCDIHDNGNGIFIGSNMTNPTKNILIQGNYIHDNSYFGDG
jgi:parallel beta-helix repeat protein